MIPVYQTIHKQGNQRGNCMQAVVASLLELPLHKVPHFMSYGKHYHKVYCNFMKANGYKYYSYVYISDMVGKLDEKYSIDGYFHAAVYSPAHYNKNDEKPECHAVIIDKDFNILHDPNRNYKGIKSYPEANIVGHNGIIYVHKLTKL